MWNIGHTWAVVGRAALSEANKAVSVSAAQCPHNSFEAFFLNASFKIISCHLNWLLSKDSNEVMAGDEAQPQVISFQASFCHLLVSCVIATFAVGRCRRKMLQERGDLYLGLSGSAKWMPTSGVANSPVIYGQRRLVSWWAEGRQELAVWVGL